MQCDILGPVDGNVYYYHITNIPGVLVIVDKFTFDDIFRMLYCIKCDPNSLDNFIPRYYRNSDMLFSGMPLTCYWGWDTKTSLSTHLIHHPNIKLPYGYRCWYEYNSLKQLEENIDFLTEIYKSSMEQQ